VGKTSQSILQVQPRNKPLILFQRVATGPSGRSKHNNKNLPLTYVGQPNHCNHTYNG